MKIIRQWKVRVLCPGPTRWHSWAVEVINLKHRLKRELGITLCLSRLVASVAAVSAALMIIRVYDRITYPASVYILNVATN